MMMKMNIGILLKGYLVYSLKSSLVYSSSFLLSPSIILTRNYCTVECSLVQLTIDIDYIYEDLTSDTEFSLSHYQLAVINQKILSGRYVLNPISVKYIKKVDYDLSKFLRETLPNCPDIMLRNSPDPDFFYVFILQNDDVLVSMGLSRMLLRLTYGRLPEEGYRLENMVGTFYSSIQQMGKVDRLYKLDLEDSFNILPKSMILDKVKLYVGDRSVYKLIESFLYTPLYDDDGKERSDLCESIPAVGEISKVLFNIVLIEIFDREFPKRFPGIAYSRFLNEVFISPRGSEGGVIFDDKAGYALLEELDLAGEIVSIGPGDDPLRAYYQMVFLDSNGKVQVSNSSEYLLV